MARRSRGLIFEPSFRLVGMRVMTIIAVSFRPSAAPLFGMVPCSVLQTQLGNRGEHYGRGTSVPRRPCSCTIDPDEGLWGSRLVADFDRVPGITRYGPV